MRAFSRMPSTGGGSAGQGYVAGQSNRATSATYFDSKGVMRVAPPKALRPNYVYKNGVWVRDGWLREGAATNFSAMRPDGLQPAPDAMGGMQGFRLAEAAWYSCNMAQTTQKSLIGSVFVMLPDTGEGDIRLAAGTGQYFATAHYLNGKIVSSHDDSGQGHAWTPTWEVFGRWTKISYYRSDGWVPLGLMGNSFHADNSNIVFCFPQVEAGNLGGTGTSYIPSPTYPITRAAD